MASVELVVAQVNEVSKVLTLANRFGSQVDDPTSKPGNYDHDKPVIKALLLAHSARTSGEKQAAKQYVGHTDKEGSEIVIAGWLCF